MLCPKCSFENKNTNIKCQHCGNPLQELVENEFIKNNVNNKNPKNEIEKNISYYFMLLGIIGILAGIYFLFKVINIFKNAENGFIIIIPVGLIAITIIIFGISQLLKGINSNKLINKLEKGMDIDEEEFNKLENKSSNMYKFAYKAQFIIFAIIWISACILITYEIVKSKQLKALIIIIPFWLFGFLLIHEVFKK